MITVTVLTEELSAAVPDSPAPKVETVEPAKLKLTVGVEMLGRATVKEELYPAAIAGLVVSDDTMMNTPVEW